MNCPHCNSTHIIKAGKSRYGGQRYKCKSCNKVFAQSTLDKKDEVVVLKECPYCGSTHTKKSGITSIGTKRYKCRDCGKMFSDATVIRPEIDKTCPVCGSKELLRGGKSNDGERQRYICKNCGIKFTDTKAKPRKPPGVEREDALCPKCGSKRVIIHSHRPSDGEPIYRCSSCKKVFIMHMKNKGYTRLTVEDKKLILRYHYGAGVSITDLAEHLKTSRVTVRKVCQEYEKKRGLNK